MGVETSLAFIRALQKPRDLPPLIVIAGPQPFLREYVLDSLRRMLREGGFQYRTFHAGNADGLRAVISEMGGGDLFTSHRFVACRVLKSNRDSEDDGGARPGRARAEGGGDGEFAEFLESLSGTNHLALLYERDNAPAKIRRIAESRGILVNCARPFDNHLGQYADELARGLGLRLASAAREYLVESYGGDLCGLANALNIAAVGRDPGGTLERNDLASPAAGRTPEVFDISNRLAHGDLTGTLTLIERAATLGRDTLEILAVEVAPILRRMLTAAEALAAGKGPQAAAAAMGMPAGSSFAARAIEGARRFGSAGLNRAHREVSALDADIKAGRVKETREALCGVIIELLGTDRRDERRQKS